MHSWDLNPVWVASDTSLFPHVSLLLCSQSKEPLGPFSLHQMRYFAARWLHQLMFSVWRHRKWTLLEFKWNEQGGRSLEGCWYRWQNWTSFWTTKFQEDLIGWRPQQPASVPSLWRPLQDAQLILSYFCLKCASGKETQIEPVRLNYHPCVQRVGMVTWGRRHGFNIEEKHKGYCTDHP